MPTTLDTNSSLELEEVKSGGLLGGLTVWHFRILCENPFEGGGGYTPEQVGCMTLDQVWFRLCDLEVLKNTKGKRTKKTDVLVAASLADKDGLIKGVAKDGTSIMGRIRGKSRARELMEKAKNKKRRK